MRNDAAKHTQRAQSTKEKHLCGIYARTAMKAAPAATPNLQETRPTMFLIERNDNHTDILGEITREIKLPG